MANIGAGEFNPAYLIKRENVTVVDSYLKATVPIEEMQELGVIRKFKYRYLTDSEMISQPIAGWLKGKTVMVIYTSEKNITFNEYDKVLLEDFMTNGLLIMKVHPQKQQGMFLFNKKCPHILELE